MELPKQRKVMKNSYHKNKANLLKGIGILFVFVVFGYYSYQDSMYRRMLEKKLNNDVASPQRDFSNESSRLKSPPTQQTNASFKIIKSETYNTGSDFSNECDTFNEHLDEFLEDPEDEITYPPEIYDALTDGEEEAS